MPISEERDDYRTPQHPTTATVSGYAATQPVKSELSVNQEDENMVTLVHTVSFYRRQQTANVSCNFIFKNITFKIFALNVSVDNLFTTFTE